MLRRGQGQRAGERAGFAGWLGTFVSDNVVPWPMTGTGCGGGSQAYLGPRALACAR
jgi:hypothetical protein